jgi:DNA modification methylase
MAGRIYCGDNLEVLSLSEFFQPEMVDLVYADPPFNSQRTFNVVYKDSNAQDEAFKDFWTWTEAAPMYARLMGDSSLLPRSLKPLMESLHARLIDDDDDLLAYLTMMTPRLVAIHRVLKRTGTMYLHCDPTASHYLKIVLDAIFGSGRFQNEIIWQRTTGKALQSVRLPTNHDVIFVYRKSDEATWNADATFIPYDPDNLDAKTASKYSHRDEDGRVYRLDSLINPNPDRPNLTYEFLGVTRVWRWTRDRMQKAYEDGIVVQSKHGNVPQMKRYLEDQEGRPLGDVWTDIPPLNSQAAERLGYPTQKPLALLARVLMLSSNHGDIVLDPFCGCGTSIEASERMGRRWFGIDIAKRAVDVINTRFVRAGLDEPEVVWQPADKDAAHALGEADKHGFEKWALRKIRAARVRSRDRGIDGEALFKDGDVSYPVIVSVKAGGVKPADVRDLRGTIGREDETLLDDGRSIARKRTIGVFVSRKEPSDEMKLEATRAGFLSVSDAEGPIPRIQFVNVERLFGPLPPIRCPGKNVTEMPKPTIPPPPVLGEQLGLDMDLKMRDAQPLAKAKLRKPGPAKTYEKASSDVNAAADSARPGKK